MDSKPLSPADIYPAPDTEVRDWEQLEDNRAFASILAAIKRERQLELERGNFPSATGLLRALQVIQATEQAALAASVNSQQMPNNPLWLGEEI